MRNLQGQRLFNERVDMKEWKIGEVRNGVICKKAVGDSCEGCIHENIGESFWGAEESCTQSDPYLHCCSRDREDNKNVIFVRVK